MLAASSSKSSIEVMRMLLDSTPHTLTQTNLLGQNALLLAAKHNTAESIDLLITFTPPPEPSLLRVRSSSLTSSESDSDDSDEDDAFSEIRQQKLDTQIRKLEAMPFVPLSLDAQDNLGYTAIHTASCVGNLVTIDALLSHDANPYIPNFKGWDPIAQARTFQFQKQFGNLIQQYQARKNGYFRPRESSLGSNSRPTTPSGNTGNGMSGLGLSHVPMGPPASTAGLISTRLGQRPQLMLTRPSTASGGGVHAEADSSYRQYSARNQSLPQGGVRIVTEPESMGSTGYERRDASGRATPTVGIGSMPQARPDSRRQMTSGSVASNASTVRERGQRGLLSGVRMRAASGDG